MSSKEVFLSALISNNKNYTIDELKHKLLINSDEEFFNLLFKYLHNAIKNIPVADIKFYIKDILKIIDYLILFVTEKRIVNYNNIIVQINDLDQIIKNKKTKCANKKNILNIYDDLLEKNSLYNMLVDIKQDEYEADCSYLLLITLIDQVQNYRLIKYLLEHFPELTKVKTPTGRGLLEQVIEQQIKIIKTATIDDYLSIYYYNSIIDLLLLTSKGHINENQIINYIYLVIDDIRRDKLPRREREQKIFFLNQLREKLNNLEKNKKPFTSDLEFNVQFPKINDYHELEYLKNKHDLIDLTDKQIITIDPEGARCLDDAFSIEGLSNGNFLLGIYITDLSNFVSYDDLITLKNNNWGQTIYLPNQQLSMLPLEMIINNNSLLANRKRGVIACFIEIDKTGNIIDYHFQRAIIKNNYQLSYKEADQILSKGNIDNKLFKIINKLDYLSNILATKNNGHALYKYIEQNDLKDNINTKSHQIVSEYMVLMNYLTAKHAVEEKYPYLYRIHKKMNLTNALKEIKGLQEFINFKGKENEDTIKELILSSLSKAKYSVVNKGHEGLGLDCYSHSTSPIRRYVDLVNQRIINDIFLNKKIDDKVIYFWENELPTIAELQNIREEMIYSYLENYYQNGENAKIKELS
jgi:hypothetical protein